MSVAQLQELAGEIRQLLIDTVAQQGGHLSPNLGVVELTLAMHLAFDAARDRLVFDVGHQAYVHKILTGRREAFTSLRAYGGLAGFPRRDESPCDAFGAGHASTAVSAALGLARARDFLGESHHVVAVLGDGALTGGMSYEALNDAGSSETRLIVVLNDNEMSISRNVGGLSKHLTRLRASSRWRGTKLVVKDLLVRIPGVGKPLARGVESLKNAMKHLLVSGEFFESLGFSYLGPIDGHDIPTLLRVMAEAKQMRDGPVLLHVVTQKGRGYERAERQPDRFHGVPPFLLENGHARNGHDDPAYGEVAAHALVRMAARDPRVVAITAAMRLGTGLSAFEAAYPRRCLDVGIAEEHAMTLAAGMAAGGMRPYFAVYSTFLQRAYDQLLHDVCLQKLPVCLLIDRAGLVGEDGPTHHGVFDLSFMRAIPHLCILAPRDIHELEAMMAWTLTSDLPCAIRYARDGVDLSGTHPYPGFALGHWECLEDTQGAQVALLSFGRMVPSALLAAQALRAQGIAASVVNASTLKPLDARLLADLHARGVALATVEEHALLGGFGEMVSAHCLAQGQRPPLVCIGLADAFVTHGALEHLLTECGLTPAGIAGRVRAAWEASHG